MVYPSLTATPRQQQQQHLSEEEEEDGLDVSQEWKDLISGIIQLIMSANPTSYKRWLLLVLLVLVMMTSKHGSA